MKNSINNLILESINEGLIMSHNIEQSKDIIYRKFKDYIDEIEIGDSNDTMDDDNLNKEFIYIKRNKNKIDIDDFNKLINNLGFFINRIELTDKTVSVNKMNIVNGIQDDYYLILESKYGVFINLGNVVDGDGYIYHSTLRENYKYIKKYGLKPKHNNTLIYFPERIYFSLYELSDKNIMKPQLVNQINSQRQDIIKDTKFVKDKKNKFKSDKRDLRKITNSDYITIKIKISDLPYCKNIKDGNCIKFYVDSMSYSESIFTTVNISPKYLIFDI